MQAADVETQGEDTYLDRAVRKASLRGYLSQDLRNAGSAVRSGGVGEWESLDQRQDAQE